MKHNLKLYSLTPDFLDSFNLKYDNSCFNPMRSITPVPATINSELSTQNSELRIQNYSLYFRKY